MHSCYNVSAMCMHCTVHTSIQPSIQAQWKERLRVVTTVHKSSVERTTSFQNWIHVQDKIWRQELYGYVHVHPQIILVQFLLLELFLYLEQILTFGLFIKVSRDKIINQPINICFRIVKSILLTCFMLNHSNDPRTDIISYYQFALNVKSISYSSVSFKLAPEVRPNIEFFILFQNVKSPKTRLSCFK